MASEFECTSCDGSCEAYCENDGQSACVINENPPCWDEVCINSGEIIGHEDDNYSYWNRSHWKELMTYVDSVCNTNGITKPNLMSKYKDQKFLTADSFNAVAKALGGGTINSGNNRAVTAKETLVYGSYLRELLNYAQSLMLNPNQCEDCVTRQGYRYCCDEDSE